MELNIKEMIAGGPARLRWVYRYSTSRVRHPESVAEHSHFVAMYCLMIGRWVDATHIQGDSEPEYCIDMAGLLERAVLHDLEEAVSGDFPRNFKHSNREMKRLLDQAAEKAFHDLMDPIVGGISETADESVHEEFYRQWHDAKDATPEGRILEFADFLAVLGFLVQEGMGEGNGTIGIHVAGMSKYYGKFQRPEYDFLRPLIQQAGQIMQGVGLLDTDLSRSGAGDNDGADAPGPVLQMCQPVLAERSEPPRPVSTVLPGRLQQGGPGEEVRTAGPVGAGGPVQTGQPADRRGDTVARSLDDAAGIKAERQFDYGDSATNMAGFGHIITGILQQHYRIELPHPVPGHVAGLILAGLKMGRAAYRRKEDTYVDGINFFKVAHEADRRKEGEV